MFYLALNILSVHGYSDIGQLDKSYWTITYFNQWTVTIYQLLVVATTRKKILEFLTFICKKIGCARKCLVSSWGYLQSMNYGRMY